jgi:hypothetical protein
MLLSAQNAVTGRTVRRAARTTRHLAVAVMAVFLVNVFCVSTGEAMTPPPSESVRIGAESAPDLETDQQPDRDAAVCRICHARTHLITVVAWPTSCRPKLDSGSWPFLAWQLPSGGRSDFLLRPP